MILFIDVFMEVYFIVVVGAVEKTGTFDGADVAGKVLY